MYFKRFITTLICVFRVWSLEIQKGIARAPSSLRWYNIGLSNSRFSVRKLLLLVLFKYVMGVYSRTENKMILVRFLQMFRRTLRKLGVSMALITLAAKIVIAKVLDLKSFDVWSCHFQNCSRNSETSKLRSAATSVSKSGFRKHFQIYWL